MMRPCWKTACSASPGSSMPFEVAHIGMQKWMPKTNHFGNRVLAGPAINQPPTADFTVVPGIGYQASFTDGSIDNDGSVVSRSWNFGDGSPTSSAAAAS